MPNSTAKITVTDFHGNVSEYVMDLPINYDEVVKIVGGGATPGGGDDEFWVKACVEWSGTYPDIVTTVTADKTEDEVRAAFDAGKKLYAWVFKKVTYPTEAWQPWYIAPLVLEDFGWSAECPQPYDGYGSGVWKGVALHGMGPGHLSWTYGEHPNSDLPAVTSQNSGDVLTVSEYGFWTNAAPSGGDVADMTIAGTNVFLVEFYYEQEGFGQELKCSKTYSEINAAFSAGKRVLAVWKKADYTGTGKPYSLPVEMGLYYDNTPTPAGYCAGFFLNEDYLNGWNIYKNCIIQTICKISTNNEVTETENMISLKPKEEVVVINIYPLSNAGTVQWSCNELFSKMSNNFTTKPIILMGFGGSAAIQKKYDSATNANYYYAVANDANPDTMTSSSGVVTYTIYKLTKGDNDSITVTVDTLGTTTLTPVT